MEHYLSLIKNSIVNFPDATALEDFEGTVKYTYRDLANQIAKVHLLFEKNGIKKGDKIAICGRNCSNWAVAFLAIETYEAVAVSILPDFTSESIYDLVAHSESKMLFMGPWVQSRIELDKMPDLHTTVALLDFSVLKSEQNVTWKEIEKEFSEKYPNGIDLSALHYPTEDMDELALLNYTSGTTSSPKGVMLSNRSLSSNVVFGQEHIPNHHGQSIVSILPLAHMFGLMFEFLYQLAGGTRVVFITTSLTPTVLLKAFKEVKPYMILTVPLVIEKIFSKSILPAIEKPMVKVFWQLPLINKLIRGKVHAKLMEAFGGQLEVLIIGGAALDPRVDKCLKEIQFPYTCGYGMTETGPILGYVNWRKFVPRSCGKIADRMEIRVDSPDPQKKEGELYVKGANVMLGYYKNEKATKKVLADDGWMKTGDIGIVDKDGNIFIRGRNKNMILGASGQNIYPEEIEAKLNAMEWVTESLIVVRDGKLVGLVFSELCDKINFEQIKEKMAENLKKLNDILPNYCKISEIKLVEKEFEKTPKKSIKRFLYK